MRKMPLPSSFGYFFALILLLPLMSKAQTQVRMDEKFQLNDKDRIIFLGNSLFENDKQGYFELALLTRSPGKNISFRNLGWEGDNVFGQARSTFTNPPTAYDNLMQQLVSTKPTHVFFAYGNVEAEEGAAGEEKFIEGFNKLLDKTDELGAQAILFSTVPVLSSNPSEALVARNKDLLRYSSLIQEIAQKRAKRFIDLYSPLLDFQQHNKVSEDGVHLNLAGYYFLANHLEKELGLASSQQVLSLTVNKSELSISAPGRILPSQEPAFSFTIDESFLPLPLPEGVSAAPEQKRMITINGLKKGIFTLYADNKPLVSASAKSWSEGIEITQGGIFDQLAHIHYLINKKNELFFQQYRPWNETYITGFRSYEQGRHKEGLENMEYIMTFLENQSYLNNVPKSLNYELVPVH